jgi:outer membrane protein assembly factor BamD (BamD/ComL family)
MEVTTSPCRRWRVLLPALLVGLSSCASLDSLSLDKLNPWKPAIPTDSSTETLVLGPDGLVADKQANAAVPDEVAAALAAAREHFRREEYDKAETLFVWVADKDKNPPAAIQEAMYYRAECLRLTGSYPKAADVYSSLLGKFPSTQYREQCVQHMFDIANYWLDDTRNEMKAAKEKADGKRWLVWPQWFHLEKTKPFLDEEGRAIEKLEQVRLYDMTGPLADQALFMCGTVKMYNENYREAETYFSQIAKGHKDSPLSTKALELAIFCKHMSTGGSDYDGRKTAEARKLVEVAFHDPQLANDPKKRKFLEDQIKGIDLQQAEKDYKIAEFYRHTGHPGSAYFYYELVRRRYPNTKYARLAEERWNSLRAELEKDQEKLPKLPAKNAAVAPNTGSGWQTPTPAPAGQPASPAGAPAPPASGPPPLPADLRR